MRFLRRMWMLMSSKNALEAVESTQHQLERAWIYLWDLYSTQASTIDRDFLLPAQREALDLLYRAKLEARSLSGKAAA